MQAKAQPAAPGTPPRQRRLLWALSGVRRWNGVAGQRQTTRRRVRRWTRACGRRPCSGRTERRRLIKMVREAPLHAGHLKNMLAATEMGAVTHPPMPAFYTNPRSIDDVVNHFLGRVLDCFGLHRGRVQ